jgi:hypothetical protein
MCMYMPQYILIYLHVSSKKYMLNTYMMKLYVFSMYWYVFLFQIHADTYLHLHVTVCLRAGARSLHIGRAVAVASSSRGQRRRRRIINKFISSASCPVRKRVCTAFAHMSWQNPFRANVAPFAQRLRKPAQALDHMRENGSLLLEKTRRQGC